MAGRLEKAMPWRRLPGKSKPVYDKFVCKAFVASTYDSRGVQKYSLAGISAKRMMAKSMVLQCMTQVFSNSECRINTEARSIDIHWSYGKCHIE